MFKEKIIIEMKEVFKEIPFWHRACGTALIEKRTGRRGHCALLPEIRPNSLAAEFLNAYLDEVGNKPIEM